uniref:Ribosomal protein L13 n=1 Tax=Centroceras clavulatum TaxID=159503 RepID=A0A4D6WN56_9FLOR|nr:ribosomal protein L13 [Centroceras clavulatum]
MSNNTMYLNTQNSNQKWYIIDAKTKKLGRMSTTIANILKGKYEYNYTPNINHKNYIIVINSKYITVTGQKKIQKLYKRHSGRPGSMKIETFNELQKRIPNRIIEKSVKGMLPKGRLGRQLFTQLKVYEEHQHPHNSQQPKLITID